SLSSDAGMTDKSDYAQREEAKHRRKIVLPVVIPWEYGSNKYASQKGSGGFGGARDATLKVFSSAPALKYDESTLPKFSAPNPDLASQSGSAPMGKFRDQVQHVKDQHADDFIEVNKLLPDKNNKRDRTLKKWDRPLPDAKNNDVFGKKRDIVQTTTGGRRFTPEELSKSRASIPRFQDPRQTVAALAAKPGGSLVTGLVGSRQATTAIEGLERSERDQLETNRYMAWLGGQLTLQSQSQTGGFQKSRDVVSNNTYEKVTKREADPRALRSKRNGREERNPMINEEATAQSDEE
ncbi:hypothetical protein PENTCL1PPCAC_25890, partial [Pristionchus entomophagus]